MRNKKWFLLPVLIIIFAAVYAVTSYWYGQHPSQSAQANSQENLPVYTETELKKYDGTDPSLPIYIAYQGNVYDVSAGRHYYQTGGSYHFLAGRDSTIELNFAGGSIIKNKYPIVGKLVK